MSLSMLAAAGGQDDILRLLIKKGVRVNGRQKNGTTALMHAAEKVMGALTLDEKGYVLLSVCTLFGLEFLKDFSVRSFCRDRQTKGA